MEIHGSSIRIDFCVILLVSSPKNSCHWVHDAWSLDCSTWKLGKHVCEPFKGPVFFGKCLWVEVKHPTSLIDLDMENYRDSVTLFKCWRLETWQKSNLFAFRQQKCPILTGWGCVSHRTKEMTRHHVPYLIWMSALKETTWPIYVSHFFG